MSTMLFWVCGVGICLLLPVPFIGDRRYRWSLVILSLLAFSTAGLSYLLSEPRGQAVSLAGFCSLIFLFWVASRFESK